MELAAVRKQLHAADRVQLMHILAKLRRGDRLQLAERRFDRVDVEVAVVDDKLLHRVVRPRHKLRRQDAPGLQRVVFIELHVPRIGAAGD